MSANARVDHAPNILPVVLCGGSGTRLWPLSRKSFPKQFVPMVNGKSLFELTLARVAGLGNRALCVTAEEHRFLVADALDGAGLDGQILLEPESKNTAAAMALAALWAAQSRAEQLLLFCPADHHIPDAQAFVQAVDGASVAAKRGAIVTFGIPPTYPATGYGYIAQGGPRADVGFQVARFIEKPNQAQAGELLFKGGVFWNAGIFLVSAHTLMQALSAHAGDILSACEDALQTHTCDGRFIRPQAKRFAAARAQSIDYAVMEPLSSDADRIAVVPLPCAWSDVGSWNAVAQMHAQDPQGNRTHGQGFAVRSDNTFIHAPHRPVVALGTQDLLIVDTPDAVLVAHQDHAEEVKEVVAQLEQAKLAQASQHRRVARPWGWFDAIDAGERFQVKRIGVKPGASISLQKHHHRAEHWVVVRGTAQVTCGEKTLLLSENQSTYIPLGEVHRLHNPGSIWLEVIEIQSGAYLGEDDIVRLEDRYGRGH